MLVQDISFFQIMTSKGAMPRGARSKVWRHFENILLADDDHHVLCILCKQLTQSKKTFIKVGGQIGTQGLRNHLRGAHPQAWRDIDQEEREEKNAKKKSELKVETTPKIDDAFSKMTKVNPLGKKQSDYDRKLLELIASRLVVFSSARSSCSDDVLPVAQDE